MNLKVIFALCLCFLLFNRDGEAAALPVGEFFQVIPIGGGNPQAFSMRFNMMSEQHELREGNTAEGNPIWSSFEGLTVKGVIAFLNRGRESATTELVSAQELTVGSTYALDPTSIVYALAVERVFLRGDEVIEGQMYRAVNEAEWLGYEIEKRQKELDTLKERRRELEALKERLVDLAKSSGR